MTRDNQTTKPQAKRIKYAPPQLLKLEAPDGKGLCGTGSTDAGDCFPGGNAGGNCWDGSSAPVGCLTGTAP